MEDLLTDMEQCKTVDDCIRVATMDAFGEYEEATGWLTCLETLFEQVTKVKVLGEEATLEKFNLAGELYVVAVCRRKNKKAKVSPESIDFPKLTKMQTLWLKAWKKWSQA